MPSQPSQPSQRSGWHAALLGDVPLVPQDEPGDPDWHPLQHYFGLTAFGANAYTAAVPGELIGRHDETGSGQEELYVVVSGAARFVVDGETVELEAPAALGILDPQVVREAVALAAGTTVLAVGGEARERFQSSWDTRHFEGVPRA